MSARLDTLRALCRDARTACACERCCRASIDTIDVQCPAHLVGAPGIGCDGKVEDGGIKPWLCGLRSGATRRPVTCLAGEALRILNSGGGAA